MKTNGPDFSRSLGPISRGVKNSRKHGSGMPMVTFLKKMMGPENVSRNEYFLELSTALEHFAKNRKFADSVKKLKFQFERFHYDR